MSLKRCSVSDLVKLTSRKVTDEGYLIAPGNLARAGNVQEYRARELGLDGGDKIIRLYRPKEEVFHADTLASFDGKPLTLNHPKKKVTAANWRETAVGDVRDIAPADDHVGGMLIVRDGVAVSAIVSGKSALSCGYDFDFDPTSGTTADGQPYDGIMRQIRINHHAIVDTARGGPSCRVADNQGDRAMRKIVVDGISIELEDTQASIVEKVTGDAEKARKAAADAATAADAAKVAAETALAAEKAATVKLVADHAAKVKELEAKIVTDAQLEALAADRSKVVGDAGRLVEGFKPEGKSVAQIRAEVVTEIIAKDEALKPVAVRLLKGADVAKPESALLVEAAFEACAAVKGTTTAGGGTATAGDSALGRALLGEGNGRTPTKLFGSDLMMARSRNGGMPLPEETAGQ